MGPAKPKPPEIVTFSDHQVITPDTEPLRRAVVPKRPGDPDPVENAEKAVAQLEGQFDNWMLEECKKLNNARNAIKTKGLSDSTREALYRAADDVKANAGVFGYQEAAPAADSLCRLLEHSPEVNNIPLSLIEQHVDAIRAIVREYDRNDVAAMAAALNARLRQVTDEFLVQVNRHRPEYLQIIKGPALAPGSDQS